MDVEKRLLRDAESFAKEIKLLDEEGALSRTLTFLGLADSDSNDVEKDAPGAGRIQRPAPAGGEPESPGRRA
ncbi:hypothetical protein GCM10022254_52520 [Actinomadura meridiana]|uniref:Uncharacterized protein n=1 Tax=Actinomadura meridiana TaxID=559626 RepID=A0ABP8CDU2_9ACTN